MYLSRFCLFFKMFRGFWAPCGSLGCVSVTEGTELVESPHVSYAYDLWSQPNTRGSTIIFYIGLVTVRLYPNICFSVFYAMMWIQHSHTLTDLCFLLHWIGYKKVAVFHMCWSYYSCFQFQYLLIYQHRIGIKSIYGIWYWCMYSIIHGIWYIVNGTRVDS